MTMLRTGLLAIASTVGCTSSAPPPSPTSASARVDPPAEQPRERQQVPEPVPLDDAPVDPAEDPRFRCATDGECTQTCALGAVNTAWLRAHQDADTCDDGCYWKSDSVGCKDGSCVTLTAEGEVDPSCTHVTTPRG